MGRSSRFPMLKKRGRWSYYRKVIPANLRGLFGGRWQIMESLHTTDESEAKVRLPTLHGLCLHGAPGEAGNARGQGCLVVGVPLTLYSGMRIEEAMGLLGDGTPCEGCARGRRGAVRQPMASARRSCGRPCDLQVPGKV